MALLDDMFEGGLGTGVVAAIGVAVLAPVVTPVLRTTAKLAIRGGMMAYDYGRQKAAELSEVAGDLAAEARAEAASADTSPAHRSTKSSS
jgi:hypothetical protein